MELTERTLKQVEDLKKETEMYERLVKEIDKLLAELESMTGE